jgi:hypothetical protein
MVDKVRENRVRRAASRQGYQLVKSRRRDPLAVDFGTYWLVDPQSGGNILGGDWGVDLDEVEERLRSGHIRQQQQRYGGALKEARGGRS